MSSLISILHQIFDLKDLGEMHFFLGIEATKPKPNMVLFNQAK